ncbi:MAG: glycosyltransferase, partial [Dehalococcoidia bacterium]
VPNLRRRPLLAAQAPALIAAMAWASLGRAARADLVHAHFGPTGLAALPARYLLGRPLVVSLHGSDGRGAGRLNPLTLANRQVLPRAHRVIAVNSDLAAAARALGTNPGRLHVIFNGVDVERFRPLDGATTGARLLCVGRLVAIKGLHHLLAAMPHILGRVSTARLTVVGDGPLRAPLESLARDLGVAAAVRFVGMQPHSLVQRYLNEADVFVLPSLKEGLPGALLEAMACARAVVATGVGGVPEVIASGDNGVIVLPASPEAIAAAVVELLKNAEARDRMGRAARQTVVERCAWPRVAAQTLAVYRQALA